MQFKVPLQSEIGKYMKDKKGWPDSFIEWYSDKFWNHYQSQGWKLSNGVAMKDWKAAFNSNWAELKWDALEKLKTFKQTKLSGILDKDVRYMLERIKEGPLQNETLLGWYDYLKESGMRVRFAPNVLERIKQQAGNNKDYGKVLCMKEIISNGSLNQLLNQAV